MPSPALQQLSTFTPLVLQILLFIYFPDILKLILDMSSLSLRILEKKKKKKTLQWSKFKGFRNSAGKQRQRPNTFPIRPRLVLFYEERIIAFFLHPWLSSLGHSLLVRERTSVGITLGSWQESTVIIVWSVPPGKTPAKA